MTPVTRPTGMSMSDWADQVTLDLDRYGYVSKLQGDDWQGWAVQFLNNVALGRNLPDPYGFEDWLEWAERFCGVML